MGLITRKRLYVFYHAKHVTQSPDKARPLRQTFLFRVYEMFQQLLSFVKLLQTNQQLDQVMPAGQYTNSDWHRGQ